MEENALLNALLELAGKTGIEIRQEGLGGQGGGLCVLRGRRILFVDRTADLPDRIARTAEALATLEGLDEHFILPQVREIIEKYRTPDNL